MICSFIKEFIDNAIVYRKRLSLYKYKNIRVDKTVKIYPETRISAKRGKITIRRKSCIRGNLEIQRGEGEIEIGENCYIGDHTRIWSADSIKIGNNVLIAHNVNIFDNDTHPVDFIERRIDAENIIWKGISKKFLSLKSKPINIEDDVWICCNSIILKGVKVGKGAIVSAGSVVTSDVPSYVIVGGNPARILKDINHF